MGNILGGAAAILPNLRISSEPSDPVYGTNRNVAISFFRKVKLYASPSFTNVSSTSVSSMRTLLISLKGSALVSVASTAVSALFQMRRI